MRFVQSGTSEAMPAFERFYISFFDVDGESVFGASMFELQAVLGAASLTTAPTSTLETGSFSPSRALYAIASQSSNINLVTRLTEGRLQTTQRQPLFGRV